MKSCLLRWGDGLLVVGLMLLGACDPRRQSVPDEEPADAGADAVTAAPMCPYAPMPLGACEGFQSPEPACVVDVEGGAEHRQFTFDAAGRQIGYTTDEGVYRTAHDEMGRRVRVEYAVDGCVVESLSWLPGDPGVVRIRLREGEWCSLQVERDGVVVQSTSDRSCDCREARTSVECALGPHGPLRCVFDRGPEVAMASETHTYDDAGRRVGLSADDDGDSVPDRASRWVFDADGRLIEECFTCAACIVPAECHYVAYEDAPRREIHRYDEGIDGWAEYVHRATFDGEGRIVLTESGDDGGLPTQAATVYDDRGGHRTTWTHEGRVTSIDELVVEGDRHTWTFVDAAGEQHVDVTVFGEHGGLIERSREVRGPRGEVIEVAEELYVRDAQGRVIEHRSRSEAAGGPPLACAIRYTWSGACPAPPVEFTGDSCAPSAP